MVVAGKLGLYSMLRFHVGLFPAQARALAPCLIALAVIGILYGACLALVQRDFWRLMAFAALSHLSLIVLGIYGLTFTVGRRGLPDPQSRRRRGRASSCCSARLYDRYATSQIASYGGLAAKLPRTATLFVIASLAMIGLPMLSGFVGEFLILSEHIHRRQPRLGGRGRARRNSRRGLHALAGAAPLLRPRKPMATSKPAPDLRFGELAVLWPLARAHARHGPCAVVLARPRSNKASHPPQAKDRLTCSRTPVWFTLDGVTARGGPAVNPVPDIYRILPEVILTLTGVVVMLD